MRKPSVMQQHIDPCALPTMIFKQVASRHAMRRDRAAQARQAWENFGMAHRDPAQLRGIVTRLARAEQWQAPLMFARLRGSWRELAGEVIATHSSVAQLTDGVLTLHVPSAAWQTHITYMLPDLLRMLQERVPEAGVERIRIVGGADDEAAAARRRYRFTRHR